MSASDGSPTLTLFFMNLTGEFVMSFFSRLLSEYMFASYAAYTDFLFLCVLSWIRFLSVYSSLVWLLLYKGTSLLWCFCTKSRTRYIVALLRGKCWAIVWYTGCGCGLGFHLFSRGYKPSAASFARSIATTRSQI